MTTLKYLNSKKELYKSAKDKILSIKNNFLSSKEMECIIYFMKLLQYGDYISYNDFMNSFDELEVTKKIKVYLYIKDYYKNIWYLENINLKNK